MGTATPPLAIAPPRDAADLAAFADLMVQALGFPPTTPDLDWLGRVDPATVRVARIDDRIVAASRVAPCGQWFGGRAVPMGAVGPVAVAPDVRGRGIGQALMAHALVEMRAAGIPLATLYPSTQPVYRRVGYEQAGVRLVYRAPLGTLARTRGPGAVRPMTDADRPAVRALCDALATERDGCLARTEHFWRRALDPLKPPPYRYVIELDGALAGHAVLTHEPTRGNHYDVLLTDHALASRAAQDTLLAFLAQHRAMGDAVTWPGGPADPIAAALPVPPEVDRVMWWLARVVDFPAAIAARGFLPGVQGEAQVEIPEDPVCPWNAGRWIVEVADGRGVARPGGRGELRLEVRALGPLFTGHADPDALALQGLCDGPPESRAAAATLFAGPAPFMHEAF